MSIFEKDIKILWGKAAGRCSMPDCRKKLVETASEGVPSRNVLIGKNCHIVAGKTNGPRGISKFSTDDRNRYPNLILLCSNHHTIIDSDPDSWPIEILHQIKTDHEIWVETQLTEATESQEDELYSILVNEATEGLYLAKWDVISDNAVRDLLLNNFVEGVRNFGQQVFTANWPGKRPELEEKIKNLSSRVYAYVRHFMSLATHSASGKVWREDKSWSKEFCSDYWDRIDISKGWQNKNYSLLSNIVVALNEFADAVRSTINPHYFFFQGKFSIWDQLGVRNNMEEAIYLPEEYIDAEL